MLSERAVHKYSLPVSQFPILLFESVRRLASRIGELAVTFAGCKIKMLKGDVKSAFRHIPVSSSLATHFVGSFRHDLTVIDLSLLFGWTRSPAHYGAFGSTISFLVARESPRLLDPSMEDSTPFFSFVWVDDHILIEPDVERRSHSSIEHDGDSRSQRHQRQEVFIVGNDSTSARSRMGYDTQDRIHASRQDYQGSA